MLRPDSGIFCLKKQSQFKLLFTVPLEIIKVFEKKKRKKYVCLLFHKVKVEIIKKSTNVLIYMYRSYCIIFYLAHQITPRKKETLLLKWIDNYLDNITHLYLKKK